MFRKFLHQCKRVLQVARKPRGDEYMTIAKITGIGMVIIGIVGFLITLVAELLKGA